MPDDTPTRVPFWEPLDLSMGRKERVLARAPAVSSLHRSQLPRYTFFEQKTLPSGSTSLSSCSLITTSWWLRAVKRLARVKGVNVSRLSECCWCNASSGAPVSVPMVAGPVPSVSPETGWLDASDKPLALAMGSLTAAQLAYEDWLRLQEGRDDTPALLPGGWSLWAYPVVDDSPYLHRHVEIWRHEWPTPHVCNPWSLPAQMNIVDLYWRPVQEDTRG